MDKTAYIKMLTDEAVGLLKEMTAIPSPSFNEAEVCTYLCRWMDDKGISYRRSGNNIIAGHIVDPEHKTLMLCAHIDTVSPSPEYSFDPYKPEYDEAARVIGEANKTEYSPEDIVAGLVIEQARAYVQRLQLEAAPGGFRALDRFRELGAGEEVLKCGI